MQAVIDVQSDQGHAIVKTGSEVQKYRRVDAATECDNVTGGCLPAICDRRKGGFQTCDIERHGSPARRGKARETASRP